jgi:hypothetical protein
VSNDIEQEWSSKHLHLIEQAEKQKILLDERRHDEEQAMLLETEEGKEDFFDMMHTGKREHNQDEGGSVVSIVPVVPRVPMVSVDQSDDMTQQEAEEYMMFGALGRPAQQTDNSMAGDEGGAGHALVAFCGPPSTPPMTNMPSPQKQSDNEDWRKIPKFISKTKTKTSASPYRSVLELAQSSRYCSPKHTEESAERQAGVVATQAALKLLDELHVERDTEGMEGTEGTEGTYHKQTSVLGIDDELPAFMLLEDCWNSVQLARDTMDKINNKDDRLDTSFKVKKNGVVGSSVQKKTSPLDKYKPDRKSVV